MAEVSFLKTRWYQTWWGVMLLALGVLALAVISLLIFLTAKYWWQIKQGRGDLLRTEIFGQVKSGDDLSDAALAAKRKELESATAPALGEAGAKLTIVEFIDFRCPNSQAAAPVVRKISQQYGDKVRIIIRAFPMESVYPGASKFSEVASCALEQGRFWEMHDLLFNRQKDLPDDLTSDDLAVLAAGASVDKNKLQECLDSGRARVKVNADYAVGFKYGVQGTPTFFVNGEKLAGTVPWEVWDGYLKNF